jgi:hypothetical protein
LERTVQYRVQPSTYSRQQVDSEIFPLKMWWMTKFVSERTMHVATWQMQARMVMG